MSTTKTGSNTALTSQNPILVSAEAKTEHQTATLTGEYTADFQASTPLENSAQGYQSVNNSFERQKLTISFCPKCKMLLRMVASNPSSLRCKKCGYHLKLGHHVVFGGKTPAANQRLPEIAVIDKEKGNLHTFPIVTATCERCGKTESETWTVAVGSEGTTSALTFLRCTHCGFTRREVG